MVVDETMLNRINRKYHVVDFRGWEDDFATPFDKLWRGIMANYGRAT